MLEGYFSVHQFQITKHFHKVKQNFIFSGRQVAKTNLETVSNVNVDQQEQLKRAITEQMTRPTCNKNDLSRLERILMASRNEDLNLAALISAVERDIWYMEQLEQNPSVLRRKNR